MNGGWIVATLCGINYFVPIEWNLVGYMPLWSSKAPTQYQESAIKLNVLCKRTTQVPGWLISLVGEVAPQPTLRKELGWKVKRFFWMACSTSFSYRLEIYVLKLQRWDMQGYKFQKSVVAGGRIKLFLGEVWPILFVALNNAAPHRQCGEVGCPCSYCCRRGISRNSNQGKIQCDLNKPRIFR